MGSHFGYASFFLARCDFVSSQRHMVLFVRRLGFAASLIAHVGDSFTGTVLRGHGR